MYSHAFHCLDPCGRTLLSQIQAQHEAELSELERRLSEAQKACGVAEITANESEERLSALKQAHFQSLCLLEKSVGHALGEAVVSARQRAGGGGSGAVGGQDE